MVGMALNSVSNVAGQMGVDFEAVELVDRCHPAGTTDTGACFAFGIISAVVFEMPMSVNIIYEHPLK